MELDADVHGPPCLKEACGPVAVEGDLRIGSVMTDGNVVLDRKISELLEEAEVRNGPSGVVRVVHPEDFRPAGDVLGDSIQVG